MGRRADSGPSQLVRGLVYDRDERRCQSPRCGSHRELTIQHRIGRGMGGRHDELDDINRPSNLLTLCHSCHMRVELQPRYSDAHGWSVPPGVDPADHPVWTWRGWLQLHDEGTARELPDHTGVPGCSCGCVTTPAGDLWAPIATEGRPSRWTPTT